MITEQEREVIRITAALYNALAALPVQHPADMDESIRDIHNIQNRVMARATARADTSFFSVVGA